MKTFDSWKKEVDAILVAKCGLSSEDIPDWDYYTAWQGGYTPTAAARLAVKEARSY